MPILEWYAVRNKIYLKIVKNYFLLQILQWPFLFRIAYLWSSYSLTFDEWPLRRISSCPEFLLSFPYPSYFLLLCFPLLKIVFGNHFFCIIEPCKVSKQFQLNTYFIPFLIHIIYRSSFYSVILLSTQQCSVPPQQS